MFKRERKEGGKTGRFSLEGKKNKEEIMIESKGEPSIELWMLERNI